MFLAMDAELPPAETMLQYGQKKALKLHASGLKRSFLHSDVTACIGKYWGEIAYDLPHFAPSHTTYSAWLKSTPQRLRAVFISHPYPRGEHSLSQVKYMLPNPCL